MKIVMMLFYLVLVLIGVSFAALNASTVSINFYIASISMPLSVLITVTLGMGFVVGVIIFMFRYWRLKSEYRKIKQQLKLTEREIKNLRTMPVTDHYTGFGDHA